MESISKASILIQSLVFQIRLASPLEVLDHLQVGASSVGSRLEPGMVSVHHWEERGSSKVIWLSHLRLEVAKDLLIMCV